MPENNSNEHSEQSDPSATETSGFDYINVRRYLAFIEHSIQQGLTWVTFEPNNPQLWAKGQSEHRAVSAGTIPARCVAGRNTGSGLFCALRQLNHDTG